MIQLALWLVSLVIVAWFALFTLAWIVKLFGAIFAPSPAAAPAPSVKKDSDTPPWLTAMVWISFLAGPTGGAMLADEANRNPKAPMPGWMYVALGVVLGAVVASCVYGLLIKEVTASRKEKARRQQEHEADVRREHQRVREEARAAALATYPDTLDDDTLRDSSGLYAWPDDMFARLFVVPDVVIPYKTKYGHDGELRLWSKVYIAEQSRDPDYVEYRREVERERAAFKEELRREVEAQREEERQKRKEEEARRVEHEALAARKARQVIIPLDELKQR